MVDAPLTTGRTLSDPPSGVYFTPIATGGTAPDRWIDVVVNIGPFPNNTPPTLNMGANAFTVPVGTPVGFTAFASDPNGDPLAYFWDFTPGFDLDNLAPNSANVSHAWGGPGEYVVRCVVSDMKGGIASAHTVVRVGGAGMSQITGRVLTQEGVALEGVRIKGVPSGPEGYTDSQGNYILAGIPGQSQAYTPVKAGYTFSPPSVNLSGPTTDVNFTAIRLPEISIVAVDSQASESCADGGRVVISRTGPLTSLLTVDVGMTGPATEGSDYQWTVNGLAHPAPDAYGIVSVQIPIGIACVDINLTALSDAVSEGTEAMTFHLVNRATTPTHIYTPLSAAKITIHDTCQMGPAATVTMALAPGESITVQEGGSPNDAESRLRVSRTGALTSALPVVMRATPLGAQPPKLNVDFQVVVNGLPLEGEGLCSGTFSLVIPAGMAYAEMGIRALNDPWCEPVEDVKVTVEQGNGYVANNVQATLSLISEDPFFPTITSGVFMPDGSFKIAYHGGEFAFLGTHEPTTPLARIDVSQNLTSWSCSFPIKVVENGFYVYTDTSTAALTHKFYRVARLPEPPVPGPTIQSANALGFVKTTLYPGVTLICNPLSRSNNHFNAILSLPNTAIGAIIYRWDPSAGAYGDNIVWGGTTVGWTTTETDPAWLRLEPGESIFVSNPLGVGLNVAFIGDIFQFHTVAIPGGSANSRIGSQIPRLVPLGSAGAAGTLKFPAADGDTLFRWNPVTQAYLNSETYFAGYGWFGGSSLLGPTLNLAEGFIIMKPGATQNWLSDHANWTYPCP
jgi:hypothetical protein